MAITKTVSMQELKGHLARRISDYRIQPQSGATGVVDISLRPNVARTFRAHWTGYRLVFTKPTLVLVTSLNDGSFWTEAYLSLDQPSWVMSFRKQPHKSRGTGAERPDDKLASSQSIEIALAQRKTLVDSGAAADEEIIRYEDFDSPTEAIDQFFNYMSFYCLRAVNLDWTGFGYRVDPSVGWDEEELKTSSLPIDSAIDEGLKKSDILWLALDTEPERSLPCWFLYTKDKRIYILSGEPEQTLPRATQARGGRVLLRRKGRDAELAEFDVAIRSITAGDSLQEFQDVAKLLVAKRQSVSGTVEETIRGWMDKCVILEVAPRG